MISVREPLSILLNLSGSLRFCGAGDKVPRLLANQLHNIQAPEYHHTAAAFSKNNPKQRAAMILSAPSPGFLCTQVHVI
jgi:hypothetical protein